MRVPLVAAVVVMEWEAVACRRRSFCRSHPRAVVAEEEGKEVDWVSLAKTPVSVSDASLPLAVKHAMHDVASGAGTRSVPTRVVATTMMTTAAMGTAVD